MTTGDPLLDAILANPDDDAPRLVWADREGGERGELVIVQCAIAAGNRAEHLLQRERELLARSFPWRTLGELGQGTLTRGFVEHLFLPSFKELETHLEEIFTRQPTIRSLEIRALTETMSVYIGPTAAQEWERASLVMRDVFRRLPAGRIRRLQASPHVYESGDWSDPGEVRRFGDAFIELVVEAPSLAELRELLLMDTAMTRASIPRLAKLTKLEQLRCANHELDADGLIELLRAVPTLRRLAPWTGKHRLEGAGFRAFVGAPEFLQLQQLDLLRADADRADIELVAEPIRQRIFWRP